VAFSLTLGERTLSGPDLIAELRAQQGALAQVGVGPGEVVAFVARVDEPTLLLALALFEARIPFFPLHPRAPAAERADLVAQAGARLVEPSRGPPPPALWLAAFDRASEATAALVATSGSTGEPKLCVLPRRAFEASARASALNLGFHLEDRWLLCLPFAHVGGLSILTRAWLAERAVVAHPGFEPEAVLEHIEQRGVSLLSAVPSMLGPLFEADTRGALGRLRFLLVGGASCSSELRRESLARDVPLVASYGLTEACSQVATQRLGQRHDPESLDSGHPLPGVEISIVDGRISLSGPTLARSYLGEEPWSSFTTGDLGELDGDGRLFVHGRADDVIVTGGENVHPEAVQRVLRGVEGVSDALVFGVPDPRLGQSLAAALVLAPGYEVERVLERAARDLASYARPRQVVCVSALPARELGKPDRRAAARELGPNLRPC